MSQFNFIYAEEHLSHREKAVYIYLRDRADASGVCWPGIKTIARELGLSPRSNNHNHQCFQHRIHRCNISNHDHNGSNYKRDQHCRRGSLQLGN